MSEFLVDVAFVLFGDSSRGISTLPPKNPDYMKP